MYYSQGYVLEELSSFHTLTVTSEDDIYVSGSSGYGRAAAICKLNQQGDTLWNIIFPDVWASEKFNVTSTKDNGFLAFGRGVAGGIVIKGRADGRVEWTTALQDDFGFKNVAAAVQLPDGGFICTGAMDYQSFGTGNLVIWRLDSQGRLLWGKTYQMQEWTFGEGIVVAGSDVIVTGFTRVKTEMARGKGIAIRVAGVTGEVKWAKSYSSGTNGDALFDIHPIPGNLFLINARWNYGYHAEASSTGYVKMNGDGEILEHLSFETGTSSPHSSKFVNTENGSVRGLIRHSTNLDNGYILEVDPLGAVRYSKKLGLLSTEQVNDLALGASGALLVCGTRHTGLNNYYGWLARFDKNGTLGSCIFEDGTPAIHAVQIEEEIINGLSAESISGLRYNQISLERRSALCRIHVFCSSGDCRIQSMNRNDSCTVSYSRYFGGDGEDHGLDVITMPDKGNILVGKTSSGAKGGYDAFVARVNILGNIIWSKNIGTVGDDEFVKVKMLNDGSLAAVGASTGLDGVKRALLVKLDDGGAVVWMKSYSLAQNIAPSGVSLAEDSEGNLFLAATLGHNTSESKGWVLALDEMGNELWNNILDIQARSEIKDIAWLKGSLYTVGFSDDGTVTNAVVSKLDARTGKSIWNKVLEHTTITTNSSCDRVSVHEDKLYLLFVRFHGAEWGRNVNGANVLVMSEEGVIVDQTDKIGFSTYFDDITGADLDIGADGSLYTASGTGRGNHSVQWARSESLLMDDYSSYLVKGQNPTVVHATSALPNGGQVVIGEGAYQLTNTFDPDKRHVMLIRSDDFGRIGNCDYNLYWPRGYTGVNQQVVIFKRDAVVKEQAVIVNEEIFGAEVFDSRFIEVMQCSKVYCDPPEQQWEQCTSGFNVRYLNEKGAMAKQYAPAGDGTGVLVAQTSGARRHILWMKIAANGEILKARWLGNDTLSRSPEFNIPLKPKGNISVGTALSLQLPNTSYLELVRFDEEGNVVNDVLLDFGEPNRISFCEMGSDGFLYISVQSISGVWASSGNSLLKVSTGMELIWCRNYYSPVNPGLFKAMDLNDGFLYLVGEKGGHPDIGARIGLAKVNAGTGDVIWEKEMYINNRGFTSENIFFHNGKLLVMGRSDKPAVWDRYLPSVLTFTPDGEIIDAIEFEVPGAFSPNVNFEKSGTFKRTADNKFVAIFRVLEGYDDICAGIMKFNEDGEVEWNWKYPGFADYWVYGLSTQGNHIYVTGSLSGDNIYPEFVTYNKRDPVLLKLRADGLIADMGNSGACMPVPQNGEIGQLSITESFSFIPLVTAVVNVKSQAASEMSDFPFFVREQLSCFQSTTCENGVLKGPDAWCSTNEKVIYRFERNPGCKAPVVWEVDTAMASIMAFTDDQLEVIFKKEGRTLISVSILEGCTIRKEEMKVVVSDLNKFQLPESAEICPGNEIELHAGEGFSSYLWENGATTPSIRVTHPDIYTVTVTDFCGNTRSASSNVKAAPPLELGVPSDTAVCANDTLELRAKSGLSRYEWESDRPFLTVEDSIIKLPVKDRFTIKLTAEGSTGCSQSKEINVSALSRPQVDVVENITLCEGEVARIEASSSNAVLKWNTGSEEAIFETTISGTYWVKAMNSENGCSASDTVEVDFTPLPVFSLGADTSICENTVYELAPHIAGAAAFSWNNGSTSTKLSISHPGIFWMEALSEEGCRFRDSILIKELLKTPKNFLSDIDPICLGRPFEIHAEAAFRTYQWSNGRNAAAIQVADSGWVTLTVTDQFGCVGSDSIYVQGEQCLKGIFVPNAFTPNNDGKNDIFKPHLYDDIAEYKMIIVNRWGEKVFESGNPDTGWDGKWKGVMQGTGTFVYFIQYRAISSGRNESLKGQLNLVR